MRKKVMKVFNTIIVREIDQEVEVTVKTKVVTSAEIEIKEIDLNLTNQNPQEMSHPGDFTHMKNSVKIQGQLYLRTKQSTRPWLTVHVQKR